MVSESIFSKSNFFRDGVFSVEMASALLMLLTFPLALSVWSEAFIVPGLLLAALVWNRLRRLPSRTAHLFAIALGTLLLIQDLSVLLFFGPSILQELEPTIFVLVLHLALLALAGAALWLKQRRSIGARSSLWVSILCALLAGGCIEVYCVSGVWSSGFFSEYYLLYSTLLFTVTLLPAVRAIWLMRQTMNCRAKHYVLFAGAYLGLASNILVVLGVFLIILCRVYGLNHSDGRPNIEDFFGLSFPINAGIDFIAGLLAMAWVHSFADGR